MLEFGHLQFSDVRPFPGTLWLYFSQKLNLSSDHRLFPLGILDTVTPLHKVNTMGMNFMYRVPQKCPGHCEVLGWVYELQDCHSEIRNWWVLVGFFSLPPIWNLFISNANHTSSPGKRDWYPTLASFRNVL